MKRFGIQGEVSANPGGWRPDIRCRCSQNGNGRISAFAAWVGAWDVERDWVRRGRSWVLTQVERPGERSVGVWTNPTHAANGAACMDYPRWWWNKLGKSVRGAPGSSSRYVVEFAIIPVLRIETGGTRPMELVFGEAVLG